ncbi:uncharacterized protein F5891DRAFT_1279918 [Suillus fuscotomentosus]|uniref:Uncharacterized protein n=1 Tax=Suillus fuscotomentosus TaxID=1912939 RepID=A0AAD4E3M7_9AGAM|nr:uncharacterized protein F5891DRAFT_1279918 [Suillus fuscotomentosus]KAG1897678.1 hypothetical protein F5891DRAFT_1279918 [Suillus fuscotomentosus]
MTTNPSEDFDDQKSVGAGDAPPSYDTTPLSESSSATLQSSFFSLLFVARQKCTAVLSRIRDIVLTPDFNPSSAASIINVCAADLTTQEFSKLLQTPNIEDHTALYWAIVNNHDHASFTHLKLANIDGCPPDEIEVHEVKMGNSHQFVVSFRIRKFQRRLRITHKLNYEFVADGRIWFLRFDMYTVEWKWRVLYGISSPSLPACTKASFKIEGKPGRKPLKLSPGDNFPETIVPQEPGYLEKYSGVAGEPTIYMWWPLGDWVMYE